MAKKKITCKSCASRNGFRRIKIHHLVENGDKLFVFAGVPATLSPDGEIFIADRTLDKIGDFVKTPTSLPDFQVGGWNYKTISTK